ncbi:diguanylate cyclase domain-containing protein [Pseudodesulfovibrio piezophilus]|uniref:Diguanylate cyclase DosC n=1 Tax=Pseudodesulfovibrio piezophilus (strain DSM 21447 / JCM 15486 / C1TLV30) TaxID=1322246 RepID=M1WQL7_PSEP2|nr:diguanylate cyclase [Pseudodesulfovibrio piezophilus]CCH49039.1 conserved protein of unknown function [Pseudodesulfovibrio piezophilus C1TLV30]
MKPTDLTLNEQLRITDHEIIKRKGLLFITEEDAKILLAIKPLVANNLVDIVEKFYDKLVGLEGVSQVIGDAESLYRLKNHLRGYLRSLFDGQYDMEYVQSRLRIGLVHKRIGVPPKLYIAAFKTLSMILRDYLRDDTKDDSKDDLVCKTCRVQQESLEKLMLFDLILVFDTYIQGLMNEVRRGQEELEEYTRELEEQVAVRTQQLADQARRDGMTGLFNQRSFYEYLRMEISRGQRRAERFALCYIDLDKFKQANDIHGHRYGDTVLLNVAKSLESITRQEDVAARYGGDEFCLLLPQTNAEMARLVCKRLTENFTLMDENCTVTMSIGIAEFDPNGGMDVELLVRMADQAMYVSKEKAGHYITVFSEKVAKQMASKTSKKGIVRPDEKKTVKKSNASLEQASPQEKERKKSRKPEK